MDTHLVGGGEALHGMKNDPQEMLKKYLTEYYSAMKRNRLLILATIWVNLRDIKTSEPRHKTVHTVRLHLYEILEDSKPSDSDRNQISSSLGPGGVIYG